MNRLFSLRTPVGVIGSVAAFLFSLSACGEDSGNSSNNVNDFSLQVESMDELPNCSKNRLGDIAEVLGEKRAYVCDNGRWEFDHDILDSVETEDDLSACLSKNEGDSVWVVDESAVFACIDRKWEKHEKEEPESSSATKKTASSSSKNAKSSSAVASSNSAKSSGSKEQKSSSSKKQEISSSSVKKETSSTSKPLSFSIVRSSSSVKQSSSSYIPPVQSSSSMIAVPDYGGGSCAPVKASVPQGENVVWKYSVGGNVNAVDVLSADFKWTTPGGKPETLEGKSLEFVRDSVTYATSGQYSATLALTTSKGTFDIDCSPVLVSGAPITGCKCTTEAKSVDLTQSPGVEWSVTGCSTGAGLDLSYEWDGTAAGTSTSYTKVFTAEHPGYTPKLIVKNNDKTMVEVTCPSVKITEGPEFVIKMTGKPGAVDLPRGSSRVILEVDVSSSYYDCVVFCQLDREKANSSTGAINGSVNNVPFRGSDYIEVRLPGSIAAGTSLDFELDVPATCGVR